MIERVAEREDPAPADPSIGRLQPDDAAIGGRAADRAAGVRAHRRGTEAGGDRHRRAARRARRIVRGIPRVARRRERQGEIRAADREFVGLLLAEQDRAGVAQPHPGLGILVGHMVEVAPRARRGAHTARLVDVLETDRNAVQHAARRRPRRLERLVAQHQHIAVQFAVEGGDAIEIGFGQRDRREGAVGDRTARLGDGQLGRVHSRRSRSGVDKNMRRLGCPVARPPHIALHALDLAGRPAATPRTARASNSTPPARRGSRTAQVEIRSAIGVPLFRGLGHRHRVEVFWQARFGDGAVLDDFRAGRRAPARAP